MTVIFLVYNNYLYLGRLIFLTLEGELKFKTISFMYIKGYPVAEMKHGPIVLIGKDMPLVFIASSIILSISNYCKKSHLA